MTNHANFFDDNFRRILLDCAAKLECHLLHWLLAGGWFCSC